MSVQTYGDRQILLHWAVVGLVAFQFATGGGMSNAFDNGLTAGNTGGTAIVHGLLGSLLLLAMLARAWTRRQYGAPPPPETEPEVLQKISRGNHMAFYVVLIAMPIAGILAVLTGSEIVGTIHAWTSKLLLLLIAAHLAGAIWHMFKEDGVVSRMFSRN